MRRFNWGPGGPPEEAYSRVTDADRFSLLHDWTLEAVARLQSEYDVALEDRGVSDTELERATLARPILKLTPAQDSCAPVTLALTDFPGLAVRFGHWATDWFPSCGCDACDEMPEGEFERFAQFLDDVVSGRFRESLELPLWGDGSRTAEFWAGEHHRNKRRTRVPRREASQSLNRGSKIVHEWNPWPRRLPPLSSQDD